MPAITSTIVPRQVECRPMTNRRLIASPYGGNTRSAAIIGTGWWEVDLTFAPMKSGNAADELAAFLSEITGVGSRVNYSPEGLSPAPTITGVLTPSAGVDRQEILIDASDAISGFIYAGNWLVDTLGNFYRVQSTTVSGGVTATVRVFPEWTGLDGGQMYFRGDPNFNLYWDVLSVPSFHRDAANNLFVNGTLSLRQRRS